MLARRSIQDLIDQSGTWITPTQAQSAVDRLNKNNRDALEAEWELIILAALASLGAVEHEPDLGGSSRLDIRFRSPAGDFIADIRTVSDETYDRENPVQQFSSELSKAAERLRAEGIQGGFDYRVNGISGLVWQGRYKTKLTLPFVHEFKRVIFGKDFRTFIDAVRSEPDERRIFFVNTAEASVEIHFAPSAGGFQSGSYLAYNVAHDAVHTVVWQALKDKSHQLKRARLGTSGERAGVFLCDGGCGMLRGFRSHNTLTVEDIVLRFLKKSSTVDFIIIVDVNESTAYGAAPPPRFEARVWSIRERPWAEIFAASLKRALNGLPPLRLSPINTLNHFIWAGDTQHLYGRYKGDSKMAHDTLELSLRAVMDYLAGNIDRNAFERIVNPDWVAQLKKRLDQGRAVQGIDINRSSGEDDDGLVITFGGHDPAQSAFRAPTAPPTENPKEDVT